jgi:hypothetical protein
MDVMLLSRGFIPWSEYFRHFDTYLDDFNMSSQLFEVAESSEITDFPQDTT